jgi:hypothetical protein
LHSYTGNDPIGLELAGALKNVYAIASGMAEGLGYENNTRASQSSMISRLFKGCAHLEGRDKSRSDYPRIVRNDTDRCGIWG